MMLPLTHQGTVDKANVRFDRLPRPPFPVPPQIKLLLGAHLPAGYLCVCMRVCLMQRPHVRLIVQLAACFTQTHFIVFHTVNKYTETYLLQIGTLQIGTEPLQVGVL